MKCLMTRISRWATSCFLCVCRWMQIGRSNVSTSELTFMITTRVYGSKTFKSFFESRSCTLTHFSPSPCLTFADRSFLSNMQFSPTCYKSFPFFNLRSLNFQFFHFYGHHCTTINNNNSSITIVSRWGQSPAWDRWENCIGATRGMRPTLQVPSKFCFWVIKRKINVNMHHHCKFWIFFNSYLLVKYPDLNIKLYYWREKIPVFDS